MPKPLKNCTPKQFNCSSSSSKSSCSSSSSSCSTEEYEPKDCEFKRKCYGSPICAKIVDAYLTKTCLIEYKQRLITVPSENYPNLDCALDSLEERHGGYVIQLAEGTHVLARDHCYQVDDLTILGDDCPFAGVAFVQGGNPQIISDFEICPDLCPYDNQLGEGPFVITATGRRIIVRGTTDPDFSCLCQGRVVGIIHRNGTVTQAEIINVCGSSVTVSSDVGFGDQAVNGEGFFIYPKVIISSAIENGHINTTNNLTIEGVVFDGSNITLGTYGGVLNMARCVSEIRPIINIVGRYLFRQANTFLGHIYLSPNSAGTAFYQAVLGELARLIMDSNSNHTWKFTYVASTRNGVRMINGSTGNFKGSQFINNCLAISMNVNCHATIYAAFFLGNRVGIVALNGCTVSSIPSSPPGANFSPVFRENIIPLVANIGSYIIVPNASFIDNTNYGIIDASLYPTAEANITGQFGRANSLIVDAQNISNISAEEVDVVCADNTVVEIPTTNSNTVMGQNNPSTNLNTVNTGAIIGGNNGVNVSRNMRAFV